jgi:hypothetical protein
MPTGSVADQHGMCARADLLGDLGEVDGHRLAVDPGRDDGGTDGTGRTDCAEEIGRVMAIVANCRWAAAAQRPLIRQRAFLADAGFILEPDLDRLAGRARRQGCSYENGEVFLKAACAAPSFWG